MWQLDTVVDMTRESGSDKTLRQLVEVPSNGRIAEYLRKTAAQPHTHKHE
jgi:hypothetical protein